MIRVQTTPLMVCDVCRLLDADVVLKYCVYCKLCDSWLCANDKTDWWRRGKAFLKRKLESNFRGDPNYKA
jgi:hypothetical protein